MSPLNDGNANAIEDKSLSKDQVYDLLGEETETETIDLEEKKDKKDDKKDKEDKEDKKDKEDKEGEEEETTLEDELEEELEEDEPDEEKLELVTPSRRKEILAKYPNIFKDFPDLENRIYRERAYTEIFSTVKDAKEAQEKAETLDNYENEIIVKGSTESLLSAVLNTDKEAFARVVDNYLPTLHKISEEAYYHTIGNIIKHTIATMVRDGKENGIDELISSADTLNQFIFGTKVYTPPQNLAKPTDTKKDDEVSDREVKLAERQFETARDNLQTKLDNIIKSSIDKYIDPNNSMTAYVKRNASREAFEMLERVVGTDTRFRSILDKLWERAADDDYDSASMDRIHKAYLSKAQTLLPALIRKTRNEALKGLGKKAQDDENDTNKRDKKGPISVGKPRSSATSSQSSGKTDKDRARAIPKGTTSLDYLMQD